MMRPQPEAVLFDFDGTLVHIAIDFQAMKNGALEVARRYGANPDPNMFTLEMVELVRDALATRDPESAERFRREALAGIQQVEMRAVDKAEPLPGVPETLAWLRANGIGIGIVTRNCRAAVAAVIERYALPFDVLLTRDDVARVKPNPEHLLGALRFLEARPSHSIMVGDHPTDVEAGRAAGMVTAAVTTTRSAAQFDGAPDFVLEQMTDLQDIIASGAWLKAASRSC